MCMCVYVEIAKGLLPYREFCTTCCVLLTSSLHWSHSPGPFVFAVDHCFPIKGQGTVMTGTVLQGGTRIGEVSCTRREMCV